MGVSADLKMLEKILKEQMRITGVLIQQLQSEVSELNCTVINLSSKVDLLEKSSNILIADREGILNETRKTSRS